MLTDKELELVIMEIATKALSPEVYRYRTKYGLSVVYYMFDIQKLESFIFEPVYLHTEDVECLERSEEELFQIILGNTVSIMQTSIISYAMYLEGFEGKCGDLVRLELIKRIIDAMGKVEEKNMLWCITSTIRERGATGCFHTPLLRRFCEEHHFKQALLGVSNNDFAFLSAMNEQTAYNMRILVSKVSHIIDEEEKILQKVILIYDYDTDTLGIWEGNWNEGTSSLN